MTQPMNRPSWREGAVRVIDKVVRENPTARGKDLRKLLFDAYPFGIRRHHPYRIWCEEVRRTLLGGDPKTLIEVLNGIGLVVHRDAKGRAAVVARLDGEVLFVGTAGMVWHWLRATGRYAADLVCPPDYCSECERVAELLGEASTEVGRL